MSKKRAKKKPVVTVTPPECPHCGHQKHKKQRGAHRELDCFATGQHLAWFYVACSGCAAVFVIREVTKLPPTKQS